MMPDLNLHEGYDPGRAPTPAALRENFLGPGARGTILLARDGAGFVSLIPIYSTVDARRGGHLEDVYTRPERRRAGVGRALIGAAAREAARRGGTFLSWTSLPGNHEAAAFYAALGAVAETLRAHTLEGDAFRRLAAP